jgi:hypothetical protein
MFRFDSFTPVLLAPWHDTDVRRTLLWRELWFSNYRRASFHSEDGKNMLAYFSVARFLPDVGVCNFPKDHFPF